MDLSNKVVAIKDQLLSKYIHSMTIMNLTHEDSANRPSNSAYLKILFLAYLIGRLTAVAPRYGTVTK